jgi:hypothetical protein
MPRIINDAFLEDLTLVHMLVGFLKDETPAFLCELFLKNQIENYRLSQAARLQLEALGFLDEEQQIKRTWRSLIICSLLKDPTKLIYYLKMAAVEDLSRKFPQIITLLQNNSTDIPLPTRRTLAINYQLIAIETEASPEEINEILRAHRKLNPLTTFLRPNTAADLTRSSQIIFP